jgi:hypothetical protein
MNSTRSNSGFTLLETILSLALTAIIIAMLATLSRQWLSSWSLGADRMEYIEAVTLAENRLANDMGLALAFVQRPDQQAPLFFGSASELIFISEPRAADATDRLIVIRYQSDPERGVIRSTAIYNTRLPLRAQNYSPAVALLPPPFQIIFSYVGDDGLAEPEWREFAMPSEISFAISLPTNPTSSVYSVSVRAHLPAVCSRTPALKDCLAQTRSAGPTSPLMPQGQTPLQPQKVSP